MRIPPVPDTVRDTGWVTQPASPRARPPISPEDATALRDAVLYKDRDVIAINKISGLAVQGGSKTKHHLDAMLDALAFDATERPRLVHRLDKDTSGVLLLARSSVVAAKLTAAFKSRETVKTYWALVVGAPSPKKGHIDMALAKRGARGGEKVVPMADGSSAETDYAIIEAAARRAAWLGLRPKTGRTHQLRVHMSEALGTPIVGDGKYGGANAFLSGLAPKLHLHAREIRVAHPRTGRPLAVSAPLIGHMAQSWAFLGFDEAGAPDPFEELD